MNTDPILPAAHVARSAPAAGTRFPLSLRRTAFAALVAMLALALVAGPALAAGSAKMLYHGPRTAKVIALTFDDGWSVPNCTSILNTLVARKVPATFFPNAVYWPNSSAQRAFWQRVAKLGFPIGNHTWNHKSLPTLSHAAKVWEINHNRAVMEKYLGVPTIRVLRPPYGAWNADTLAAAKEAGYSTVLNWDTSDGDTGHGSLATQTRAGLRGTNGSVVLLHCGPNSTPQILNAIITGYRNRGFKFVTVPQLLGLPGPAPVFH